MLAYIGYILRAETMVVSKLKHVHNMEPDV